ncbi:MAG: DUF4401 domain-containing protein [Woeseiaceae bacterium]|jgi:uncharacterized membrane protein|nr:DUF4401 domain-containing protein [Woeseiaceae bacterium]
MTDLERFCAQLNVDRDAAAAALAAERAEATSALSMPWFARLVVGVGAWITALSAIGVGSVFLFRVIGTETTGSLVVLGAGFLALGLWMLRRDGIGTFADQLGTAVAAAGVGMIAGGFAESSNALWLAALATAFATAVVILLTPKRTLQFLAALLAAVLFAMALVVDKVPYYLDIAALAGPAGVLLVLRPPRRDLQPTAIVLLLLLPVLGIYGAMDFSVYIDSPPPGGWFAKVLHIGLFGWLAMLHWTHGGEAERSGLKVFVPVAAVVCLLLPAGGSAALVIMMLAFVVGSRPLALLGTLLQIHYLWRLYYDLDVTLLAKSGVLTAAGIVLLVAWWLLQRRSTGARS